MKDLQEYVSIKEEDSKYAYPMRFGFSFDEFMKANNVDEQTVTEDMMSWFAEHVWDKSTFSHPAVFNDNLCQFDKYVNEMLSTTSIDLLVKKLSKALQGLVVIYDNDDVERKSKKDVYDLLISEDAYDKDKIADICDKMLWSWTSVYTSAFYSSNPFETKAKACFRTFDGHGKMKFARIKVEPVQAENRTTYVQNYCDGMVYHLCTKDAAKSIMKGGLRMRGEHNQYRYIKNKVYFVCASDKSTLKVALLRVASSKGYSDFCGNLSDDTVLLKLDVSDYNVDFYMDKMYPSDIQEYVVYSYAYFPPKMIEVVDFDEEFGDC